MPPKVFNRAIKSRFRPQVEILEARDLPSTFTVAPTGSDSNNGISAPWLTLQHAANSVNPGDTVLVETGTYKGFDIETGGTAAAPITFEASPGATPLITSPESLRGKDGINIEDIENGSSVNYVTIQGFHVDNSVNGTITEAGIRAVWNGAINSTGIVLNGNTINDAGTWGIITGHEDHLLIEYNTCSNSQQQHGIYVGNAAFYPVVKGNILFGNAGCGLHMNGDASQGAAIEPDGTSDGNNGNIVGALVEDNIIYNNGTAGGSAINGDGVQNSLIENNLLYDNHASGITLFQTDAALPSTNNVIVNNTVIEASNGRWAVNIQNGSTANAVFNNILLNNNSFHGSIAISSDSLPGFVSDHNIITTNSNAFDQVDSGGNDNFMSVATWQGSAFPGTGQDANSVAATAAQLFVNAGANDYHLVAGSPAIDAGVASFQGHSAPTTDLDGNPRPSGNGYDIGAYEFQSASAPAAPINLTATAGNGQIVLTWSASSGAASYDVYRGTSSDGENATPIATGVTTTNFTDNGLTNGTTYFYEVSAINAGGQSGPSPEASATPTSSVSITLAPTTLPGGTVGGSYSQIISAAGGSGFTYQVTTGSLPPGLALNPNTGLLSGMPYSPNGSPFGFTVTATDNLGNTGSQVYHLAIASPLGTSPNAIYVENVYGLLLYRAADSSASFWIGQLNGGMTPSTLVSAIEGSTEYLDIVMAGIYEHYLNRTPDPTGLGYWVGVLQSGESIEQVIEGFIASPEFYQVQGGGTNGGFVTVFYQDILNRKPDPSGFAYWVNALNTGATSPAAMAWGFLGSLEYKEDLVSSYYQEFLRRPADSGGLLAWARALQAGLSDQAVLAAILGSAEGYADWS